MSARQQMAAAIRAGASAEHDAVAEARFRKQQKNGDFESLSGCTTGQQATHRESKHADIPKQLASQIAVFKLCSAESKACWYLS